MKPASVLCSLIPNYKGASTGEKALTFLHQVILAICQMNKIPVTVFSLLFLSFLWVGCKDPYDVKVKNSQRAVLVVEGFLNSGGITTIKLSRSFQLADTSKMIEESGASVVVESRNAKYELPETVLGSYRADLSSLDPSQEYRLHINAGGKEYVSDYIKVQTTPPIDSISWARDNRGVTVYANTHDPSNQSRYYMYDFTETWEIKARYYAFYMYDNGAQSVRWRSPGEEVYRCWKTVPSSSIHLATSTALQNDVISEKPLVFIPGGDKKLNIRYSILVKQFVLSKEAYEFFQLMKKNTETLGTIFDPQPTQLTGNIRSVNDKDEHVIGFFYGSSEEQKRIFIDAAELPNWGFRENCSDFKIEPHLLEQYIGAGLYPYDAKVVGLRIVEYSVTEPVCFDCTIGGGVTAKPLFW
jgi:hypothetical protein